MKPDWDSLGDAFKDNDSVQILDVDCTAGGKSTCGEFGVRGYPTVKYFTGSTDEKGDSYSGGRDLKSLKTFVETNLIQCNVADPKDCNDEEKAIIKNYEGKAGDAEKDHVAKTKKLADMRKARRDAQKQLKDDEKVWAAEEKELDLNIHILKQMAAVGKDEL